MSELPSTEFRKTFHRLTEPTTVTALGRPIGVWQPGGVMHITQRGADQLGEQDRRLAGGEWVRLAEVQPAMFEAERALNGEIDRLAEEVARLKRQLAARPPVYAGLDPTSDLSFTEVGVPGRPELRGNESSSDPIVGRRSRQAVIDQALGKVNKVEK